MWRLLIIFATLAWAQPNGIPKLIFPEDTLDPKVINDEQLLDAVCPGHSLIGQELQCSAICPQGTDFAGIDSGWSIDGVTRGHFLSPSSDDDAVSMVGCEPHSLNFGGTILLTRRSGAWTKLWYKAGVPTSACHRTILPSRRETLVCWGTAAGQGNVSTEFYVEDLLAPKTALMSGESVFGALNNIATCSYNSEDETKPYLFTRDYIERVEFHSAPSGEISGISVFGRKGTRKMTPRQVQACLAGKSFLPPTKPYRVDFAFDGAAFKPVGKN